MTWASATSKVLVLLFLVACAASKCSPFIFIRENVTKIPAYDNSTIYVYRQREQKDQCEYCRPPSPYSRLTCIYASSANATSEMEIPECPHYYIRASFDAGYSCEFSDWITLSVQCFQSWPPTIPNVTYPSDTFECIKGDSPAGSLALHLTSLLNVKALLGEGKMISPTCDAFKWIELRNPPASPKGVVIGRGVLFPQMALGEHCVQCSRMSVKGKCAWRDFCEGDPLADTPFICKNSLPPSQCVNFQAVYQYVPSYYSNENCTYRSFFMTEVTCGSANVKFSPMNDCTSPGSVQAPCHNIQGCDAVLQQGLGGNTYLKFDRFMNISYSSLLAHMAAKPDPPPPPPPATPAKTPPGDNSHSQTVLAIHVIDANYSTLIISISVGSVVIALIVLAGVIAYRVYQSRQGPPSQYDFVADEMEVDLDALTDESDSLDNDLRGVELD